MKAPARLALLLLAGLSLAGCATTTAMNQPKSAPVARSEQPMSARDYWYMRDIDDKLEASFAANGSR